MIRSLRRPMAERGFSIVELLVVMATISALAMLLTPRLMRGFERARQRRTVADMRAIAGANATLRLDSRNYAAVLTDLEPRYMNPVPPMDGWGAGWVYAGAGASYTLTSLGSDSLAGPAPPTPWYDLPFEPDLIVTDGAFSQAPDHGS